MAGPTVKEILLKWSIDLGDVNSKIDQLNAKLDAMNQKQVQQHQQNVARVAQVGAAYKNQVINPAIEAAAKLQALQAAEQLSAKQVVAERAKVIALLKQELQPLQTKQGLLNAELTLQKRLTSELQRQQAIQERTKKSGTILPEVIKGIGGLAGGGLTGAIFSGALLGGGIGSVIPELIEGLGHLAEKIGDVALESDRLRNISKTFANLTKEAGIEPTQFMEGLRKATKGTIDNMTLMTETNKMMLVGLKLSQQQFIDLAASVHNFADSQGINAVEAQNMLTRALASGRLMYLAYGLGLSETVKKQMQMAQQLPDNIRMMTEYNIVQSELNKQNKRVGDEVEGVSHSLERLKTSFENLGQAVAMSFGESWIAKWMTEASEAITNLLNKGHSLSAFFIGLGNWVATPVMKLTGVSGMINRGQAAAEWQKTHPLQKRTMPLEQQLKMDKMMDAGEDFLRKKEGEGLPEFPEAPSEAEKKAAMDRARLAEATARATEEKVRGSLQLQQELYDTYYKNGLMSQQDYNTKSLAIIDKRIDAEKKAATEEAQARRAQQALENNFMTQMMKVDIEHTKESLKHATPDQKPALEQHIVGAQDQIKALGLKDAAEEEQLVAKLASIDREGTQQRYHIYEQYYQQLESARRTNIDTQRKLVQAEIDEESTLVENQFKQAAISADEYALKRVALIERTRAAAIQAARDEAEIGGDTQEALAKEKQKDAEADIAAQKELTRLYVDESTRRAEALEQSYDRVQKVLENQAKFFEQFGTPRTSQQGATAVYSELIRLDDDYIAQLRAQLAAQQAGTDQWFKTIDAIQKAEMETLQYKDKIIEVKNSVRDIDDSFGEMSITFETLSGLWEDKAKGLWSVSNRLAAVAKGFQDASKQLDQYMKTKEMLDKLAEREIAQGKQRRADNAEDVRKGLPKGTTAKAHAKAPQQTIPVTPETLFKNLQTVSDKGTAVIKSALDNANAAVGRWHGEINTLTDSFVVQIRKVIAVLEGLADVKPETEHKFVGPAVPPELKLPTQSPQIPVPPQPRRFVGPIPPLVLPELSNLPTAPVPQIAPATPQTTAPQVQVVVEEHTTAQRRDDWPVLKRRPKPPVFGQADHDLAGVTNAQIQAALTPEEAAWLHQPISATQPPIAPPKTALPDITSGTAAIKTSVDNTKSAVDKWHGQLGSLTDGFVTQARKLISAVENLIVHINDSGSKLSAGQSSIEANSVPANKPAFSSALSDLPFSNDSSESLQDKIQSNIDALNKNTQSLADQADNKSGGLLGNLKDSDFVKQIKGIGEAFKGGDAKGGLKEAAGLASEVTQEVGGLASAAKGQGGALHAGLTGLMSGAELGGQIGGPIGMAVGAAVGGILGVFSGKARAEAEKISKEIQSTWKATIAEIQQGTQTLSAGIAEAQIQIQTAVSQLSGKKGGRDQLQQILPGMEEQLQQLQDQQKQVITTFDQRLEVLATPQVFQDELSQIQSIIQAYTQYIQAGGAVANANEFLQQSFENLAVSGLQQLNQDEQDAINNALNYNDLLLQQQELILQTNQQIMQLMSQGAATRQLPAAVSKGIQLQQLLTQSQIQQDQLNQQISVANYKMQVEQKIFGLATTRIGLENQLIQLQDASTDYSVAQMDALIQVIGQIQNQIPTSMAAALSQLGLGAAYVPPERATMPTPPVPTGIPDVDQQNQAMYAQALQAWYAQSTMPVGYINPAGTPAFSVTTGTSQGLGQIPSTVPGTTPIPSSFGPTPPSQVSGPIGQQFYNTLQAGVNAPSWGQKLVQMFAPNGANMTSDQMNQAISYLQNLHSQQPSNQDVSIMLQSLTNLINVNNITQQTPAQQNGTVPTAFVQSQDGTITPVYNVPTTTAVQTGSLAPTGMGLTIPGGTSSTTAPTGGAIVGYTGGQQVSPASGTTSTTQPMIMGSNGQLIPLTNTGLFGGILSGAIGPATTSSSTMIGTPSVISPLLSQLLGSPQISSMFESGQVAGVTPMAEGGYIDHDQLIYAHTGETVVPANSPIAMIASSTHLNAEQQIATLVNTRAQTENAIVSMKMQEIQADMNRIQQWNALLDRVVSGTKSSSSIEDALASLYGQRGQQGFGGFSGEL